MWGLLRWTQLDVRAAGRRWRGSERWRAVACAAREGVGGRRTRSPVGPLDMYASHRCGSGAREETARETCVEKRCQLWVRVVGARRMSRRCEENETSRRRQQDELE